MQYSNGVCVAHALPHSPPSSSAQCPSGNSAVGLICFGAGWAGIALPFPSRDTAVGLLKPRPLFASHVRVKGLADCSPPLPYGVAFEYKTSRTDAQRPSPVSCQRRPNIDRAVDVPRHPSVYQPQSRPFQSGPGLIEPRPPRRPARARTRSLPRHHARGRSVLRRRPRLLSLLIRSSTICLTVLLTRYVAPCLHPAIRNRHYHPTPQTTLCPASFWPLPQLRDSSPLLFHLLRTHLSTRVNADPCKINRDNPTSSPSWTPITCLPRRCSITTGTRRPAPTTPHRKSDPHPPATHPTNSLYPLPPTPPTHR